MITDPMIYLLVLALFSALFFHLAKQKYRFLNYIPAIVLLYMSIMFLSSFGLFEHNEAINGQYKQFKSNLLPAMLFMMLVPHRLTHLLKLGPKMLLSFFLASLSLFLAFIAIFILFSKRADEISILAPLAGSWMGGTANMLALTSVLNSSESDVGIIMLIDSVDYSLWVMFLLLIVPYVSVFNRFVNATSPTKDILLDQHCSLHFSIRSYAVLILSALGISLGSQLLGIFLSNYLFGNASSWSIILATLAGIGFAYSPLSQIRGIASTANALLYFIIALIASRADLSFDMSLIGYLLLGIGVLFFHAVLMIIFAKLFKLDLFSISVASLANIGGIASAPILCAAYAQSLVGIGVLMATLGYIIGTFVALLLSEVLQWLV